MQPKRIGLLIKSLSAGGAEKVISNISKVLDNKNDIYLFVYDSNNIVFNFSGKLIDLNCRTKGIKIHTLFTLIKRIVKLSFYKKKLNLDVMISFMPNANFANIYSWGKTKRIVCCRGYGEFNKYSKKYYNKLSRISKFVVQTKRMKDEFVKQYNCSSEKIFVLENLFDINDILKKANEQIEPEIKSFIETHKTIVTVGSYKKDKGFWHLIKVFYEVKKTIVDAGLIIIGHGGSMYSNIKKMVLESEYNDDILLYGYSNNPYKYISKCDIFTLSSIHEGFPNVLVEAMLCKTPVISTDCLTGPREILRAVSYINNELSDFEIADFGVLVPKLDDNADFVTSKISENEIAYAKAIIRLMKSTELKYELSEKAFESAKKYDIELAEKKLADLIV